MAKNFIKPRKHETGRTITTKTPYGITSDMLVKDEEILSKVQVPEYCVLVHDDMGYFIVNKERVDDGLACPFRYDTMYRESSNEKIMEAING
jgi:hypothetical protein